MPCADAACSRSAFASALGLKDDLAAFASLLQRARHAGSAAADVVHACKVRVLAQEGSHQSEVQVLVVLSFAQADYLQVGIDLLQDVEKAHLALAMGTVAKAPGDHCNLRGPVPDEASQHHAGGSAGGAIVESEVGHSA